MNLSRRRVVVVVGPLDTAGECLYFNWFAASLFFEIIDLEANFH